VGMSGIPLEMELHLLLRSPGQWPSCLFYVHTRRSFFPLLGLDVSLCLFLFFQICEVRFEFFPFTGVIFLRLLSPLN